MLFLEVELNVLEVSFGLGVVLEVVEEVVLA